MSLPHGRKRALAAGRLVEQKGFDLLIEAFARVAGQHPQWDLVIVGDGPLRTDLEHAVRRRGLQNRVFLPGKVGNIGDWYEAAHLFVLSSRFEGFANVLAESLSHGLPAISFDCPTGPADIIRHGVDGLLVPPNDVGKLAAAMSLVMNDENLRSALAARAVEARERFSVERIAAQWEALFGAARP